MRQSRHIVLLDQAIPEKGSSLEVFGPEAQHALRVKRLEAVDVVELRDGAGGVGTARLDGSRRDRGGEWVMQLEVVSSETMAVVLPVVTVVSGVPKGERLEQMIDALSQAGVAAFHPLASERAIVRPREGKLDRLQRIARESLGQCGRAHLLAIGEAMTIEEVIASAAGGSLIVGDALGTNHAAAADRVTIVIGPEGGLTAEEVSALRDAGGHLLSLGPHIMRIETAALAASVLVMRQRA